jgi:hypothetical protein
VSWRYDTEECEAIAAEVFCRIRLRYHFDGPHHVMGMYKKALAHQFHTLARETRAKVEAERQWGQADLTQRGEVDYNDGQVTTILAGASAELREVMTVVADAPTELLSMLLDEADDKTWSRRLSRLCCIKQVSETLISELRDLLRETPTA